MTTSTRFDPDLDDDKALKTLIGKEALVPETEKDMILCGHYDCPTRTAESYDPWRNEKVVGQRFFVPDPIDGEVWTCSRH